MSAKLQGRTWITPEGIIIDTPSEALIAPIPVLMAWSRHLGCPLLFPDIRVTRRLTAHLMAIGANDTIRAFGTFDEILDWAGADGTRQIGVVEYLLDNEIVVWYMAARTPHRLEKADGEGTRTPVVHGSTGPDRQ